jgi:GT2 family glycosyltransferase
MSRPASSQRIFRVLVITPTLGQSRWLDETVAGVARLPLAVDHVLVGPAAELPALAARFPQVGVVPDPGGGMYAAINAGLAACEKWDAFTYINDDDLLLPRFAQVVAQARTRAPRIVYGGVQLINTHGRRIGSIPISAVCSLNRLLYAQRVEPVYQHGTLITRAVFERWGGFDAAFRFCGDSEFLARACVNGVEFKCATLRAVAAFRLRAGQLTKNLPAMLEEHHRVHDKLQLPAAHLTPAHRWARLVFRFTNLPIYADRIVRHGFLTFGEMLAKVE